VDWRAVWDPSPHVWEPMPQQWHMLQPSSKFGAVQLSSRFYRYVIQSIPHSSNIVP
jgi:hypothetical protein